MKEKRAENEKNVKKPMVFDSGTRSRTRITCLIRFYQSEAIRNICADMLRFMATFPRQSGKNVTHLCQPEAVKAVLPSVHFLTSESFPL